MIKKIYIIFIFTLILFNINNVEATTIDGNTYAEQSVQDEERNSKLKIFITDSDTIEGIENVTVQVEEIGNNYIQTYTTNERGIISIDKIAEGQVAIKFIDVPTEYLLPESEYVREIRYGTTEAYEIRLNHKKGGLIIKSDATTAFHAFNEKGEEVGVYCFGEEGEVYIERINTGTYILKQIIISPDNEEMEDLEFVIKENEICELDLRKKSEENNSNEETSNVETSDNEAEKETEDNKEELDLEENTENNLNEETSNVEAPDNETEKEIEDNEEELDLEENTENNSNEETSNVEAPDNETEKDVEDNKEELDLEENTENNLNEETSNVEASDNETEKETEDNKEVLDLEENTENNSNEEAGNVDVINNDIKNISNQEEIVLDKLPRTGEDYFEVKLILFDLFIIVIFASVLILKNRPKNSLLYHK